MGKVGASILGGAVGFVTGGVGGAIAGAAQPWATAPAAPAPPAPPAQTRTGAFAGGPSAPGLGAGGAGLPSMMGGSGLGSMTPSSLPGAPAAQFFGTPPRQPAFTPRPTFEQTGGRAPPSIGGGFAARLRAMRTGAAPAVGGVPRPGSFAARLAARRGAVTPTFPTFPSARAPFPAAAPVSAVPPWLQAAGALVSAWPARTAAPPPPPTGILRLPGF